MKKLEVEVFNYKLLEKFKTDLSGMDIVIFEGDNAKGKSSLINGILENFMAKSISTNPLTNGEKEGEKRIVTKDKNGNDITIIHTFDKEKPSGSFYAIQDGKSIRSVTQIRELLGEVNTLTVDELFQMCKTTAGRREFIRTYLYSGITDKDKNRLEEIENYIKPRTGILVTDRAKQREIVNTLKAVIDESITPEEQELISMREQYEEGEKQATDKVDKHVTLNSQYVNAFNAFDNIKESNIVPEIKDSYKGIIKKLTELMETQSIETQKAKMYYDDRVKPKMDTLRAAIVKQSQLESSQKRYEEAQEKLDKIEEDISKYNDEKEDILKRIVLPEGVKIHSESDFSINGLDFSQADTSESEAWMLLAELTMKQFSATYMRMGSASLYNKEKLNKLAKLANEHNKIIALERVIEDHEEINIVGKVYDDLSEHEIKTHFKANTNEINSNDTNVSKKEDMLVETKLEHKDNDIDDNPKTIILF